MGIVPFEASLHDAASSARFASGGYAVHSEKLSTFRPSVTPRTMSHDTGAMLVYRSQTVAFE